MNVFVRRVSTKAKNSVRLQPLVVVNFSNLWLNRNMKIISFVLFQNFYAGEFKRYIFRSCRLPVCFHWRKIEAETPEGRPREGVTLKCEQIRSQSEHRIDHTISFAVRAQIESRCS